MSFARERFRRVISRPVCTLAANIFDPLSARIAYMLDYEVCFLSGSVGKVANLGVPDIVMTNMSDLEVWPESHWPGFALREADVFKTYTNSVYKRQS